MILYYYHLPVITCTGVLRFGHVYLVHRANMGCASLNGGLLVLQLREQKADHINVLLFIYGPMYLTGMLDFSYSYPSDG